MTINELILAVEDKKLSKDDLENYRDQMSALFAKLQLEMADKEKEEALFMGNKTDEQSVAERKVQWKATPSGQRLIELKRWATALKEMLSSLRNRLFQIY